ncbi:hypothetical protein B0H14DRAFT_3505438 [Mycena olivaceomarginata]|nr:hypothetical protein B0H14DRAFT_3505438 [Mycena olivaceomarginata]
MAGRHPGGPLRPFNPADHIHLRPAPPSAGVRWCSCITGARCGIVLGTMTPQPLSMPASVWASASVAVPQPAASSASSQCRRRRPMRASFFLPPLPSSPWPPFLRFAGFVVSSTRFLFPFPPDAAFSAVALVFPPFPSFSLRPGLFPSSPSFFFSPPASSASPAPASAATPASPPPTSVRWACAARPPRPPVRRRPPPHHPRLSPAPPPRPRALRHRAPPARLRLDMDVPLVLVSPSSSSSSPSLPSSCVPRFDTVLLGLDFRFFSSPSPAATIAS